MTPGSPAVDRAGGTVDPSLALALADEMMALTTSLSNLAFDLGSAPETLRRHMESLQAIDEITQRQLAIAEVLRSDAPVVDRLGAITLAALNSSLTTRYASYCGSNDATP